MRARIVQARMVQVRAVQARMVQVRAVRARMVQARTFRLLGDDLSAEGRRVLKERRLQLGVALACGYRRAGRFVRRCARRRAAFDESFYTRVRHRFFLCVLVVNVLRA